MLQAEDMAQQAVVKWLYPHYSPPSRQPAEVPSYDMLQCELWVWAEQGLLHTGSLHLCVFAGEQEGRSTSICETLQKLGLVTVQLPLQSFSGIVALSAQLRFQDSGSGGILPNVTPLRDAVVVREDEVKLQKSLRPLVSPSPLGPGNPFVEWWSGYRTGPVVGKMSHYFDIYHKYFEKYRGSNLHFLEIGIAHGGSLQMWKAYFGPSLRLTGIDCCPWSGIREELEDKSTVLFFGDQADKGFLGNVVAAIPTIDIVVDDGGHHGFQTIAAFEMLFPHLAPGGLYVTEDTHASYSSGYQGDRGQPAGVRRQGTWAEYVKDLIDGLHGHSNSSTGALLASILSIQIFEGLTLIEKRTHSRHLPREVIAGSEFFASGAAERHAIAPLTLSWGES